MSNDDRIRNWRARRNARELAREPDFTAARPIAAADAVPDDDGRALPAHATKRLATVLDALASGPLGSAADRRRVYDALQREQERLIAHAGLRHEDEEYRRRQLRMIIRLLETDIRAGVDVLAAAYVPATLLTDDARLREGLVRRAQRRKLQSTRDERRRATQQDVPLEIPLQADEAADADVLRERLARIHIRQFQPPPGALRSRLAVFVPLLRLQLHIIQGESRVALLWTLVGPIVLLSLISSLYILSGTHFILGMDVPTFSMLGATTWIMFRQIVFRTSTAYVSSRGLINIGAVTPLAVALVHGCIFLSIYLCVFAVLIGIGHRLDVISLPANPAGFGAYVVMMGFGGAALGIVFGSIAAAWRFFLRFAAVIERFLQIFSSVFFVSEQLPEQYRQYVLWSPFAHGMQLLRSSYFEGYSSQDASFAYFVTSLIFLAAIAVVAERIASNRVQPM